MDEAGGIIEEAWPDARYVGLTFFPEPGGGAGGLSSSIVIRRIRCPSVVAKEVRIQRSHNCLERTRPSVESKKAFQISSSTCVGKPERALAEIENTLDEPQDAAEVMGLVIDVVPGRESRDNDQGYAKTILVIALNAIQDGRGFVVVPATPIVPGNQDGSVGPITTRCIVPDGINNGGHPGRPANRIRTPRVIGILSDRNHPAHLSKVTGADVIQHICRLKIDVVHPILARALSAPRSIWLANVLDCIRRRPDGARAGSVIFPTDARAIEQVCHSLMFEAGIDLLVLAAGRNQPDECPCQSDTSCWSGRSLRVLCGEDASSIVGGTGRRSPTKNELVGGKAGSLISLEHVVGPAVLRRKFKVRIQNASRIVYELELWSGWASARARNIARAIHPAAVIHAEERSMCVTEVIGISQRDRLWISYPGGRVFIEPSRCGNVVLARRRGGAARMTVT